MKPVFTVVAAVALVACASCRTAVPDEVAGPNWVTEFGTASYTRMWKRIPVPEKYPDHPRLFLTSTEIEELKKRSKTDTRAATVLSNIAVHCTKAVEDNADPASMNALHAARQAKQLAVGYAFTGREELAGRGAAILVHLAKQYPTYEVSLMKGKATASTLGESRWATEVAFAYDLLYNSGALSEADKKRIEDDMLRPCAALMQDCNHKSRSNWRAAAIGGLTVLAFCLGDEELVDQAVNGCFTEDGTLLGYGFAQQIAGSILADGMWYEQSMGYHMYSLSSLTLAAEAAKRSGLDLWHTEVMGDNFDAGCDQERVWGDRGKKTLKDLFDAPFYYVFSDMSAAPIANSKGHTLSALGAAYGLAYREYCDPKYAWLIRRDMDSSKPGGDILRLLWDAPPDLPEGHFSHADHTRFGVTGRNRNSCSLFPSAGYAVLRSGPEEDALGVIMTFGKYGSGHSHPDKLHICVHGLRRLLLPDSPNDYGEKKYREWTRQTIGHNSVVVDETSQYPQEHSDDPWRSDTWQNMSIGRLLFFHPGKRLKAVRAECDNAYKDTVIDRTIVLVDSVLVDFYRVRSRDPHTYDHVMHVDAQLSNSSLELTPVEGRLSTNLGYSFLEELSSAPMTGSVATIDYSVTDRHVPDNSIPQVRFVLTGAADRELILGTSLRSGAGQGPMIMSRQKARNTTFAGGMSIAADGRHPSIKPLSGLPDGVTGFEIHSPGRKPALVVSAAHTRTFMVKGTEVTAELALLEVEEDGNVTVIDSVRTADTVSVMSFNILLQEWSGHGTPPWKERMPFVADTIRNSGADLIGIQEDSAQRIDDILEAVPDYKRIRVGKFNYLGVLLYKHERWEPKDSGYFAVVPDWRAVSWARFVERETGRGVYLYTLHFEVDPRDPGGEQRLASMKLLADHISKRKHPDDMVIVTGDFNAQRNHKSVRYLEGKHPDSPVALEHAVPRTGIDHIMVWPATTRVVDHNVIPSGMPDGWRGGGTTGSDHPAIMARLRLSRVTH